MNFVTMSGVLDSTFVQQLGWVLEHKGAVMT